MPSARPKASTMKDVAAAAGVSSATVSYVLNNLNKVSPEIDAHVRKVAIELGYSRNSAATALKTGRRHVIGCVVPTLLSPVFPEIMQAIHRRARELGYAVFVVESDLGGEEEAAQVLASHGVDGAIAILEAKPKMTDAPLFPIVVLDREVEGLDCVMADHTQGGRLIADYLVSNNIKRIGLLSGIQDLASSRQRRDGLLSGLTDEVEVTWEHFVPLQHDLPQVAKDSLALNQVEVVVGVNDFVAVSALSAISEIGLSVPSDISVIGFDDMQWASWPVFNLTTVRQSLDDLGRIAVDLMVQRLIEPDADSKTIVLPVKMVLRQSCK